jgi:two-component system CheB/CheR fusion protein
VVLAAGNAEAVEHVVRTLPERCGFAVIVACHGDAHLADRLQSSSALPVVAARGRITVESDRVFVVPPGAEGSFHRGDLLILEGGVAPAPIDRLLRSLADELGGHAAAVILAGLGADGVIGIKRVKEAGGLTIVQAPEGTDAEMPRAAIATGVIDLVLTLPEIAPRLVVLGRHPGEPATPAEEVERGGPDGVADTLRDILSLVRIRSGHDFSSYKRATLYRRVSRRMQVCQCESIGGYHEYLREHPGELGHLLRDFLISVTNFFRDRAAFEALDSTIMPRLFAGRTSNDQVRAWVTGCATGEEAYSIGMLLREHAGRMSDPPQLQVFATDIDDDALAEARAGRYPATIAYDVAAERLARFFVPDGEHFRVSKDLREIVLFSPHNVLRDPPFSRLDLISCRNLLIYLNRDAQDRVLTVFHFGLRPEGFLFLGSSESAENATLFGALDAKQRLFVRRPSQTRLGSESLVVSGRWSPPPPPPPPPSPVADRMPAGEIHHRLVEQYAPPSLLVNEDLDVIHISENAGRLLQVSGGEPSRQLLRLIHPALRLDLRTAIYAARQSGRRTDTRVVRFDDGGVQRAIELRVRALDHPEGMTALGHGSFLVFLDELDASATPSDRVPETALEPVMREIEDELRRTREQLRTTVEQYETSLEELKASNEELQAINEELRSATEELETSKEELQSVNEELTTLNHELKLKVDEISHANSDLQNLMTSTEIGVVFLDRALHIKRFTPRAQDLFNVIPSDVGRPFGHLTHRLAADDLPQLAQSVLLTLRSIEREFSSHDGRRYLARLLPYRSLEDRIDGVVLTFVEVTDLRDAIDARRRSEAALETSEARLRLALRAAPMLVVNQDTELQTRWGYVLGNELEAGSLQFTDLFASGHAEQFAALARRVLHTGEGQRAELDIEIHDKPRTYDFRVERTATGIDAVGFDITPSKHAEAVLLEADRRKDQFLATLSHELRNPLTPLKLALDVARIAGGDQTRLAQAHGIMERQVAQLGQLVDDLLDLSRITQGKIQIERVPVEAAEVIESALEATRPLIQQRHHQLTVELPEVTARVLGDHTRLTQVLTNLLNNAAKYTPEGGQVGLRADIDAVRSRLRIRVRDDGDGIAPDMLPTIFDIFVQGRDAEGRAHGGLGIGLNLVRRLVELHDGVVSATSAGPGHGSEFMIELPLMGRSG